MLFMFHHGLLNTVIRMYELIQKYINSKWLKSPAKGIFYAIKMKLLGRQYGLYKSNYI